MSDFDQKSEKIKGQTQDLPGRESKMDPQPLFIRENYKGSEKLINKVALITGGDSGIGRSVAVHFAREGADVAFVYLEEDDDAAKTKELVEREGRKCLAIKGDIRDRKFCEQAVKKVIEKFKRINILVNHAGEQHPTEKPEELDMDLMVKTFETNVFSIYYITIPVLKLMKEGDCIINTTSVTAYYGSPQFIDYSATNGARMSFVRSLANNIASRKIRVNGVAPGPTWTPLIPSTFDKEEVEKFGKSTPLERAAQPCEVATSYVFLASEDASYITGQILHPDGGKSMHS